MAPTQLEPGKRAPSLQSLFSVNPDGSRNAIHPASVRGRFQRRKHVFWAVLIGIYVLVPWLEVGGNPAFLVDIERRTFYLFGTTYTAQDFWLAFFVITGVGFSLFVLSALWGRIWCGYACPQTVFLEGVFRRIETWIEGSSRKRRELDRAPWGAAKILRRGGKYALFLVLASALAHTLLSYFIPVQDVFSAMVRPPSENLTAFTFVVVFTLLVFVNFTWFREQLCIVVCPYGRLQGVLYDPHTVNVGYDAARGEPRGKLGAEGAGDCVDCNRCVDVCPTGIDIRNGTQMECIGCANCIDACDEVMDRTGRPRGLVRYDSLAGLTGETRRFWRPRVAVYGVLLALGATVFAVSAGSRESFAAKLLRASQAPFTLEQGLVSNAFTLHVQNKTPQPQTYEITAEAPDAAEVVLPIPKIEMAALGDQRLPLFVRIPRASFTLGTKLRLTIRSDTDQVVAEMDLLGPPSPPKK